MKAIIGSEFPKIVIPLIENAQKEIKIVVFDWRWYPNSPGNPVQLFNQAIVSAVRRGVAVSALANNEEIIILLRKCGVNAKKTFTKNLVHAKLILIDEAVVIIGSHNYSQNAFAMNYEASLMFEDKDVALDYLKFFNDLWQL